MLHSSKNAVSLIYTQENMNQTNVCVQSIEELLAYICSCIGGYCGCK